MDDNHWLGGNCRISCCCDSLQGPKRKWREWRWGETRFSTDVPYLWVVSRRRKSRLWHLGPAGSHCHCWGWLSLGGEAPADVVEYSGGRSGRLASFGDTRPTANRHTATLSDNTSSSTHQLAVKQTLGTTGGKVGQAMMIQQEIDWLEAGSNQTQAWPHQDTCQYSQAQYTQKTNHDFYTSQAALLKQRMARRALTCCSNLQLLLPIEAAPATKKKKKKGLLKMADRRAETAE